MLDCCAVFCIVWCVVVLRASLVAIAVRGCGYKCRSGCDCRCWLLAVGASVACSAVRVAYCALIACFVLLRASGASFRVPCGMSCVVLGVVCCWLRVASCVLRIAGCGRCAARCALCHFKAVLRPLLSCSGTGYTNNLESVLQ